MKNKYRTPGIGGRPSKQMKKIQMQPIQFLISDFKDIQDKLKCNSKQTSTNKSEKN
jgi:hypothetical protein